MPRLLIKRPTALAAGLGFFAFSLAAPALAAASPEAATSYSHLWLPLAWLAQLMEFLLTQVQSLSQASWGFGLVLFALLIKILLYPASAFTGRLQASTAYTQAQLAPKIAAIKHQYKGEEAHNKIMAAHKELGVTPFYTLKPSLGFFIQIPVFIAIFNALGAMPQFAGQSFLWIADLSQPDALFSLGFTLPWFGSTFNLAPVLMALTAVVAALTYRLPHLDSNTLKAKRKQLIYMGLLFLVLFYPFPAAMTFYWLLANVLQLIEQNTRNYFLTGRKDD